MRFRGFLVFGAACLCSGCAADYLNHYDTVTLAAGDAGRSNMLLQTVDPFNPNSQNTHIEGDGQRIAGVMQRYRGVAASSGGGGGYQGNCPTDESTAADGSRCGKRSAESRPGGS